MKYYACFFKHDEQSKLITVCDFPVNSILIADAICDELQQIFNGHYLVGVVDLTTLKIIHTYSTKDWQRRN